MAYANERGQRERDSIIDLIEKRRETIENSQYFQGQPAQTAPIITDTFTELVQPETEAPEPEEQNVPTVEEQKKEEQPTVEPVTEPVTEVEQEPVVQPVTPSPKTDRQEETRQQEVVPQNDTETLYNDWESYLAEQDRANAVNDTATTPQPVEEAPLVTPVTPNGLPEGAMDWTPEQWAEWQSNPVNRQTAVDAANRQAEQARQDKQIEDALNFMQTDLGIPIYGEPTADDIAYAQQLLADGVVPLTSDAFASTLETPVQTPEQNEFTLNPPILSGTDPTLRPEPEFGTPEWYAENGLEWATNAPKTPANTSLPDVPPWRWDSDTAGMPPAWSCSPRHCI